MLYSLFVLIFGIYLGQEYQGIPSIKLTYTETVKLLKNKNENENENETSESNSESNSDTKKSLAFLIKNLLKKDN